MRFVLHPDGQVRIRDAAGAELYMDTLANFEQDVGATLDIPAGMASLDYDAAAGILIWYDAHGNAWPAPGTSVYPIADDAISGLDAILQARAARLQAAEPVPTLAELQAEAVAAIDGTAEAVRLRYITPGAGQAATYMIKERQAEAFQAAGYAGTVPAMVQAEVDATGKSAQQAADFILATRDAWLAKAAQIEDARRKGDVAVAAAADAAGVAAARDRAVSALAAM